VAQPGGPTGQRLRPLSATGGTMATQDGNGHDAQAAEPLLERLPQLAARIASAKAKVDEARGEVGGLYAGAGEDGYHRRALREAIRLKGMEPDKRRDYLTQLSAYCTTLGVFAQGELLDPMPRPPAPPPSAAAANGNDLVDDDPLSDDHHAQGRTDALHGFTQTRNPWPEGSPAHASYRAGWVEGEAELLQAQLAKPNRRRRRPVEPQLGV
jgi:uncharacterized protein (UPF0335 family)